MNLKRTQKIGMISHSWFGRIYTVKMSILLKAMYRFKIPVTLVTELEKTIPKFIQKHKTQNGQSTLEQKEQNRSHYTI
jgi:hypothetical protein